MSISLNFSRCRLPPFAHQREDVAAMIAHPFFFIASEMRTGKTKIVIDAAQFLFEAGAIEKVLVVAPAPVRDVWYDSQLGELKKHLWNGLKCQIVEFHASTRMWEHEHSPDQNALTWCVTNYEFIRSKNRLTQLLPFCGQKTLLVLDESSYVKNWAAQQTKACLQLRRACGRVVLLNGTPIFHSPLDLFSQGNILHPSVLDCKYVTHFKARYAIQEPVLGHGGTPLRNPRGGGNILTTTGWTNLDNLQRRFAPYTVRRLQRDCLDLPPKLDPVTLTATLTPETWRAYKDMRDELVVWLKSGNVVTSATAAVKALRLSQITGGFLGGVEAAGIAPVDTELLESIDLPGSFLDGLKLQPEGAKALQKQTEYFNGVMRDIAAEKLRAIEDSLLESLVHGTSTIPGVPVGILGNTDLHIESDEGMAGVSRPSVDDAERAPGNPIIYGEYHERDETSAETRYRYLGDTPRVYPNRAEEPQRVEAQRSVQEIGREKLDVLLWFIGQRLEADPNLHLVAWCRFRAELFRMLYEVTKKFSQFTLGAVYGGQKRADRLLALSLLKPETSPVGPVFVAGIEGTGSFGLDFTASHTCVTMSSGYSPGRSAQTLDRVYGPGQTQPIAYYDVVAVGPRGQKTIDHAIIAARRAGQDVATWTSAAWIKALTEE